MNNINLSNFNFLGDLLNGHADVPLGNAPLQASPQAACYSRFSSDLQSLDSLDQQQRACRDAARRNDHEIPDELLFRDEAVSGTKLVRAGLQQMVQAASEGRFSALYLYSLSRLARETAIAVPLVKTLVHRYGVRIVSVAEGIDSKQPGWEMALQILSLVHEQYIRDLSGNVRRGHEANQRRGQSTGDYCFGYRSVPAPGYTLSAGGRREKVPRVVVIDEEKAPWVQRIFEMFVDQGYSLLRIAKELNRLGAPKDHRSTTATWFPGSVRNVLTNPKYTGRWRWGKTKIRRDPMTGQTSQEVQSLEQQQRWLTERPELRIIADELFLSAQRRLQAESANQPRRSKGRLAGAATVANGRPPRQLLSCLIVCGHCGNPFYVTGCNGKYLGCSQQLTGDCVCKTKLRRDRGERMILAEIGRLIRENAAWREAVVTATQLAWRSVQERLLPRRSELERRRQMIEQKIARLVDLAETGKAPADLCARLEQRRTEQAGIDAELRELDCVSAWSREEPSADWIIGQLERLHEVLSDPTPAAASALRKLVGGKIVVTQIVAPGKKRGYLQGKFTMRPAAAIASLAPVEVATQVVADEEVEIAIDFIDRDPRLELMDRAWALHQAGKLHKEIAAELKLGRNLVTKLLQLAARHYGEPLEDGRSRRGRLVHKHIEPQLYDRIAEEVMRRFEQNELLQDIAAAVGVCRDTITAVVRKWHEERGLAVPDGRSRRKQLPQKTSQKRRSGSQPPASDMSG